ncbi:hypothetical protein [Singulisphaera sp. PoT]|uniref:hypothetical protein n=1 Tax=Singulisphaera sp. PoT TaxID=3411797 RepID=UPI003BF604CF
MSSETTEFPVGPHSSDAPNPKAPGSPGSSASDLDDLPATPAMPPYSSTSGDELNALLSQSLNQPKPDPFLDDFSGSDAKKARHEGDSPTPEAASNASAVPKPTEEVVHESFDAVASINAFTDPNPLGELIEPDEPLAEVPSAEFTDSHADPKATPPAAGFGEFESGEVQVNPLQSSMFELPSIPESASPPPQPTSFDAFPALDLGTPAAKPTAVASKKAQEEEDDEEDDDDDDDDAPRGPSLFTFLLLSYASAVTLGLGWVLYTGRRLHESDEEATPVAEAKLDPGRRADQSRKVEPPEPLAKDHVTTIGKPLTFGGLEVTPLGVRSKPVRLRRAMTPKESRDGGSKALWLNLRLRNVSKDTIFAPLDEAFLRERELDVLDSLIETADGSKIVMYPLAVSSEWQIDGQEFKELRPGESFDTWVVSASNGAEKLPDDLTWRVRLRTGIDQTETIGVRFKSSEVKVER